MGKNYGIITKYDGIVGNIKGVDSQDYKFLKSDIVGDDNEYLNVSSEGDQDQNNHVEFEPQVIEKTDFTFYRANYVKLLKK